jgi:hypothetical protein
LGLICVVCACCTCPPLKRNIRSYYTTVGFHRIHKRPPPRYKRGYGPDHPRRTAHQQTTEALERVTGCLSRFFLLLHHGGHATFVKTVVVVQSSSTVIQSHSTSLKIFRLPREKTMMVLTTATEKKIGEDGIFTKSKSNRHAKVCYICRVRVCM